MLEEKIIFIYFRQVFEVVAAIRNEADPAAFCETILNNTEKLFFPN